MQKVRSSLSISSTDQHFIQPKQQYSNFAIGCRLSNALSISQVQCSHHNVPTFICRNENCLSNNEYLSCSQQCMDVHFDHPNDLIRYQIFKNSLEILEKQYGHIQIQRSTKIRQTINKLLHLRQTICQHIDIQIQKSREQLEKNQKYYRGKDSQALQLIKDCIYKIEEYRRGDQVIVYNIEEEEKEVYDKINRRIRKLLKNIRNILDVNGDIYQLDGQEGQNQFRHRPQKNYEYKIQGNIDRLVKLIENTPKHIDRLKIYLNQDTYGEYLCILQNYQPEKLQEYLYSTYECHPARKLAHKGIFSSLGQFFQSIRQARSHQKTKEINQQYKVFCSVIETEEHNSLNLNAHFKLIQILSLLFISSLSISKHQIFLPFLLLGDEGFELFLDLLEILSFICHFVCYIKPCIFYAFFLLLSSRFTANIIPLWLRDDCPCFF